jgi:predicted ATPase/class 3 adenylate cyclase
MEAGLAGTVTILFTDIEGSTSLAHRHGEHWPDLLSRHHALLEAAIVAHGGAVEQTEGDAFFALFPEADDGVAAAVAGQRALRDEPWPHDGTIRVRMGLHTGAVRRTAIGLTGLEIHRAARIASAAGGGQVLISSVTRALLRPGIGVEDLGLHRLKDFPDPERLFGVEHGGPRDRAFAEPRALPVRPTNLPVIETPLIGREPELEQLRAMLSNGGRVVTLTGRGGTGKTRLAVAAAIDLLDRFPGGSWFVPLADVRDREQAAVTVAGYLGIESGGQELQPLLTERLAGSPTLLVLDNLEQLEGASEAVAELIGPGSQARVLATSQVPLRIAAEHVVALAPLGIEAGVRLFADRATQRGATVDPEAPELKAICERLDGLPLAIELAAARMVSLTPAELLARLDRALDLLSARDPDRPARQRSLRAAIEWTYELLPATERELFAALTIFATGFSLADAEALAGADVLDGLEVLLDASFVRRVSDGGLSRFTIAQALRDFGREQLVAGGRLDGVREAHARWVAAGVEATWEDYLAGGGDWRRSGRRLADDLPAAIEWARGRAPELHLTLLTNLGDPLGGVPRLAALTAEITAAIDRVADEDLTVARALHVLGDLERWLGNPERNLEHLERGRRIAARLGSAPDEIALLLDLGYSLLGRGDTAAARRAVESALALTSGTRDGLYDQVILQFAQIDVAEGRPDAVEPLLAEMLARPINDETRLIANHLYADCALLRLDGHEAVARYLIAARHCLKVNLESQVPVELDGAAMGLAIAGRQREGLEVDRIAAELLVYVGKVDTIEFWERLRERHLGPERAPTPVPAPPAEADFASLVARAVEIAETAAQT